MKAVISYKFTGENQKELENTMKILCDALSKKGHSVYCTLFDKGLKGVSKKDLFKKALDQIDKSDALLVFLKGEEKSEGMLLEVGYAIAKKKKIILMIRKGISNTHLRELIEQVYEFNDVKDLEEVIKNI